VGGSWTSLREKVESGDIQDFKFDVILSSETIYNLEYMKDFIKLLELGLKEDGVV
jgi:2-polyprenyl-3-methyl-5-hydroxy-6-metoxy-1,4-benzoquinol methylase